MFESLNTTGVSVVPEEIKDLSALPFENLKDYVGKEIKVEGYFFTEGNWGTQVSVISKGKKINMPKRCVDKFLQISNSPEMKRAVLEGKLLLTEIKEQETKNGTTTKFKYTDVK